MVRRTHRRAREDGRRRALWQQIRDVARRVALGVQHLNAARISDVSERDVHNASHVDGVALRHGVCHSLCVVAHAAVHAQAGDRR